MKRLAPIGKRIYRVLISAAVAFYAMLAVLDVIGFVTAPDRFTSTFDRADAMLVIVVASWSLGVVSGSFFRQRALRKIRPPLPKLSLMCPRCRTMHPIDEIAVHVDEHIAEGRLMSTHNPAPVTAIVRNPGDADWRIIQEGV